MRGLGPTTATPSRFTGDGADDSKAEASQDTGYCETPGCRNVNVRPVTNHEGVTMTLCRWCRKHFLGVSS